MSSSNVPTLFFPDSVVTAYIFPIPHELLSEADLYTAYFAVVLPGSYNQCLLVSSRPILLLSGMAVLFLPLLFPSHTRNHLTYSDIPILLFF